MAMHDDGQEMANSAITLEIPTLGPCEFREMSWGDLFKVRRMVQAEGVDTVEISDVADDAVDVETPAIDNLIRMIATATVAVQKTVPAATFESVADLFRPRDTEMMGLLTRIITITATGRDAPVVAEESGNGQPGQGD